MTHSPYRKVMVNLFLEFVTWIQSVQRTTNFQVLTSVLQQQKAVISILALIDLSLIFEPLNFVSFFQCTARFVILHLCHFSLSVCHCICQISNHTCWHLVTPDKYWLCTVNRGGEKQLLRKGAEKLMCTDALSIWNCEVNNRELLLRWRSQFMLMFLSDTVVR